MRIGAPEHPKFDHLAEMLGESRACAVGVMECLLHWARKYAPQGDVGKWSNAAILKGSGYRADADADALVAALVEARLLDRVDGPRLVIHDIADHADDYWRRGLEKAGLTFWDGTPTRHLAAAGKGEKKAKGPGETESQQSSDKVATATRLTTSLEIRDSASAESCPEPVADDGSRADPALLEFACVGKEPRWSLTRAKLDEWAAVYPGVDVLAECRRARQWLLDNPGRRKTARGLPAYLGRWIARSVDAGKAARSAPKRTVSERTVCRVCGQPGVATHEGHWVCREHDPYASRCCVCGIVAVGYISGRPYCRDHGIKAKALGGAVVKAPGEPPGSPHDGHEPSGQANGARAGPETILGHRGAI